MKLKGGIGFGGGRQGKGVSTIRQGTATTTTATISLDSLQVWVLFLSLFCSFGSGFIIPPTHHYHHQQLRQQHLIQTVSKEKGRQALVTYSTVRTSMSSTQDSSSPPSPSNTAFNEVEYEKDRLQKDQQAMDAMKEIAESEFAKLRTPWKWTIRKRIWDMMEETNIAQFPRPVHHRIPNFIGADQAAQRLAQLSEFQSAKCIKVNPDTPQRPVRHAVLEQDKILLTPQPRLRTGFFSTIEMSKLPKLVQIADCTTSKGVAKWGTPVTLNEKYTVDLVIVGSTAVCPTTGARVGKGEGFAELEWGILSELGNLNPQTCLVITTVHDGQVVNDIPANSLTKHDVPVDIIVTPTRVIRVPNRVPKPSGIYWDLLSPQKLSQIRVLQQLKQELEAKRGSPLPSGPDEVLPPVASRNNKNNNNKRRNNNNNNRNNNNNNNNNRRRNNNNTGKNNNKNNDSQNRKNNNNNNPNRNRKPKGTQSAAPADES